MKKIYFLLFTFLITISLTAQNVFINEIHYDNSGSDSAEGVEVAGITGTDLTGWTIELYNGSNGTLYQTIALSGTIDDEVNGYGALNFPQSSIQNGGPDGLALINNAGVVIQFLSYEGDFTATDGTASGMTSTDIGVTETSSTAAGESLQLTGDYVLAYTDFIWTGPTTASPGQINVGQTFPTLSTQTVEKATFSMYPNPTSNGFVNIKTSNNAATQVAVYDILGKQVINTTLNGERLNVSKLNAGVYAVRLSQGNTVTTKKLVIK